MPSILSPEFNLQMSKPPKTQSYQSQKHTMPPPLQLTTQALDPRSSSLAGKKRLRDSDPDPRSRARRTKSTGDARDSVAFQRGLIAVFVPNALRQSLAGDLTHYTELLTHFLPTPIVPRPPLAPLLPLLRAISAHVNLLDQGVHGGLVSAIVSLDWATGDEKFVRTYVGWAGVLISAHPGWGREVVGMAVRGLSWQLTIPNATVTITRRTYHARHHLLLSHLLSLVPTLPTVLAPLIARNFPNKREPEVSQTTWVRNCCEMIGYCPELGQRIWGEVVDRMLRIDVEITNILEEEDDDDDDDDEDDVLVPGSSPIQTPLDPFDLLISQDLPKTTPSVSDSDSDESDDDVDPGEMSSVDGDASDSEESTTSAKAAAIKAKRKEAVRNMRSKLDGMLVYFFQHLEECMGATTASTPAIEFAERNLSFTTTSSGQSTPTSEHPPSSTPSLIPQKAPPSPAQSLSHFQTLLNLFSRQILPTSSTQHIPFLLFLCSSFSPSHTDLFLGLLVSQSLYGTTSSAPNSRLIPLSQRVAATVYIGSVVCRARFVTDDQARSVLQYLLAYLDGKMRQTKMEDMPLFYAVCQAVMLIFCFRWRAFTGVTEDEGLVGDMDLDSEGEGEGEGSSDGKWLRDLDILQKLITSDLNPLLGCNPIIVSTFAKVAHQTNFAYCFSIIEANQQLSNAHTSARMQSFSSTKGGPSRQNSSNGVLSQSSIVVPRQARQANIDAGLDNYFPFDPYDLPRSGKFVEGLYRTWGEVAIDAEDEDEDDASSDEEGDTEETGESVNTDSALSDRLAQRGIPSSSMKSGSGSWTARRRIFGKDGGLSSSLEGMSISPAARTGLVGRG